MSAKPPKAKRQAAFKEASVRLRAAGFSVLLQPASQSMKATAPDGRAFHLHPTVGRWTEKKAGGNKQRHGDVKTFLAEYHRTRAALDAEAREWTALKPDLTIFTDAGLCPRTGASGWGAWMKGGGASSISVGGQIADLLNSSTEAEIRAGANAFHIARGRGLLKPGMVVMWQCDNQTALRWLLAMHPKSRDRPAPGGLESRAAQTMTIALKKSAGLKALKAICTDMDLRILTRHVKGHQRGPNRQWVNRLCDEIAGEHMRARRSQIDKETFGPPREWPAEITETT